MQFFLIYSSNVIVQFKKNKNSDIKKVNNSIKLHFAGREAAGIRGTMDDPFDALPEMQQAHRQRQGNEAENEWVRVVVESRRMPQPINIVPKESQLTMKRLVGKNTV